jgi:hypothetical protein
LAEQGFEVLRGGLERNVPDVELCIIHGVSELVLLPCRPFPNTEFKSSLGSKRSPDNFP